MGPELLYPEHFGVTYCRPTKDSDCYAFGMVIYEVCTSTMATAVAMTQPMHCQVLCGKVPYPEIRNGLALIPDILKGVKPERPEKLEDFSFTTGLWEVVERCWLADTWKRPDVKGVLFRLNHATWSWERKRVMQS